MSLMQNIKYSLTGLLVAGLLGCGGDSGNEGIYNVLPYDSAAHPNLFCAVAIDAADQQCTLAELPLIGMETGNPTTKDIRKRLLVSHVWMGDRFMRVLDKMPDDTKLLLRGVTAIVIDDDIRPSFYTSATGAIYIDPDYLWLTQAEKDTISKEEDYRSDFASELNFVSLWRYLTPEGLWARAPSAGRELNDLIFPIARLFYHELAHANDFLPPDSYDKLDRDLYVYLAAAKLKAGPVSERLQNFSPLQSDTMKGLARVMFRGKAASSEQIALSAEMVGLFFSVDVASDDYAYVPYGGGVYFEDTAMLFEELMLKYHYDLDREIAFTTFTGSDPAYCGNYSIGWGQKGRLGDVFVKERARFVLARLLPEIDLNVFIDALDTPLQSTVGTDWCEPFRIEEALLAEPKAKDSFNISNESFEGIDVRANRLTPHD